MLMDSIFPNRDSDIWLASCMTQYLMTIQDRRL
jgi:hypothetical protein